MSNQQWLDLYREYTFKQESPDIFHYWVGVGILASVLERRVWIDLGSFTVYPNQYIILIAGSALCRKSSSLSLGERLIYMMDEDDRPSVVSQKITPEAFIGFLKNHDSTGTIFASEMDVFFGSDAMHNGMIGILTDLWDCPSHPWAYETIGRGEETLEFPCINLIGASTLEWLKRCIPRSAIGGGFTSRVIFVYGEAPRHKNLFTSIDGYQREIRDELVGRLDKIRALTGPASLTDEARDFMEKWYVSTDQTTDNELMDGYFGRKHVHVLKLALLHSVGERYDLVITKEHVETAMEHLERVEALMPVALGELASTEDSEMTSRVLRIIQQNGVIDRSDLTHRVWRYMNAKQLADVLDTLIEAKMIQEILSSNGKRKYSIQDLGC